jgi:hypothetical protein
MPSEISLLTQLFSLLILSAKFSKSCCNTALSRLGIALGRPKIAKFPDNREIYRRLVRSALRRQPGGPALGQATQETPDRAGNSITFDRRMYRRFNNIGDAPALPGRLVKGAGIGGIALGVAASVVPG